jgi:hypothetical protein
MGDARIKVNTKSLRVTSRGDEYVETFLVTGLEPVADRTPWDALGGPGIPEKYTNPIPGHPELYVRDYSVQAIPDSKGGDYEVEVVYAPLGGNIDWGTQQVRWSIGATTTHTDVDLDGKIIGKYSFEVPEQGDLTTLPLPDHDAEYGIDVYTGTVELEVSLPAKAMSQHLSPALMAGLTGTVNADPFVVTDVTGYAVTIQPDYCLYLGGLLDPVPNVPGLWTAAHRFTVGSIWLPDPTSIPTYFNDENSTPWDQPDLPIRYGYWTVYRAKDRAGEYITFAAGGALSSEDYYDREPKALIVAPIYAQGGNFNTLFGVT